VVADNNAADIRQTAAGRVHIIDIDINIILLM
jgi:hypothetical protein